MKDFFEKTLKLLPDENGMYKCPLHISFEHTVYIQDGHFLCLHCGASGDAEQLNSLMKKGSIAQFHYDEHQKRIIALNHTAMEYFQNSLARSEVAKKYVANRGLNEEILAKFSIGFANSDWVSTKQYLTEKGYTEDEMVEAGVAFRSTKTGKVYDFYRSRIMFPIKDAWGNVVGFSGRTIVDDERKYLNTSENSVFRKRQGFFNLNNFDATQNYIIVCEGQMDAIAFARGGISNSVASLGTALTLAHARMLSALTSEIYLCFDGDNAGQAALAKAKLLFEQLGVIAKTVTIPQGCKDPDEVLERLGEQGLMQMITTAK
jgi:DNA primase